MTELENVLPFSGIDPRGRVKFSVLLEMFQQMADEDASKYGLSVRQTLEHDITWVLRKYRIDLERYPTKESGNITIRTYAEPFRNLFSLRSFKLWDSHGGFLGSAYTWWVLIDFIKQRPIRLDKCELMKAFMDRLTDDLARSGHKSRVHFGSNGMWNVQVGPWADSFGAQKQLEIFSILYPGAFVVGD